MKVNLKKEQTFENQQAQIIKIVKSNDKAESKDVSFSSEKQIPIKPTNPIDGKAKISVKAHIDLKDYDDTDDIFNSLVN